MIAHNDSENDEQLLDEAIAEFLRAEMEGHPGKRQQWLDRYPACASALAEFFDDRERFDRLMSPVRNDPLSSSSGCKPTLLLSPNSSERLKTSDDSPKPPHFTSARYRPLGFHARGGMGEIWIVEDERIGRKVALKKLRSGRAAKHSRFLVEAQVTGQLQHPSVVPLHDVGYDDDGQPYYVMKFVQGRSFRDAIVDFHSKKPSVDWADDLQFRRLLEILVNVCNAVAYAHSKRVLHRDIKPENVMLGPFGETMVLDWGLAKVVGQLDEQLRSAVFLSGGASTATQDGAIVGTPLYVSPEGAGGDPEAIDQSSDVYLLGATLYEILTARPPRQGSSQAELINLARHSRPTDPRRVDPTIPRALEAICLKAMAFDKRDRYENPLLLIDDVQRFMAGEQISAYRDPLLSRIGRWIRRHRRGIWRGLVAVVILILGCLALNGFHRARTLAQQEHARTEVIEFEHLVDKAQFFAANTDPISEHAPYYDPSRGQELATAALAISSPWGKDAYGLSLPNERASVLRKQYELLLMMARINLQDSQRTVDPRGAFELLEHAKAIETPTRGYYQLRARCFKLLGETEAAQQEEVRMTEPDVPFDASDHFLQGELLRLGDNGSAAHMVMEDLGAHCRKLEQAIAEYRIALTLDPKYFWARYQLGRCLLALNRAPEAVETFSTCIAMQPTSAWAHSARGLANAATGKTQEALQDLDRAVQLDASFQPARLNRGIAHWLQNDIDDALADFSSCLNAPDDKRLTEAAFYRGQLLLRQHRDEEAETDFSMLLSARPDLHLAYWYRAQARFLQKKYDEGQTDISKFMAFKEKLTSQPSACDTQCAVGKGLRLIALQLEGGQRREVLSRANAQLQAAVAAGSPTLEVLQNLGAVQEMLGHRDDAIKSYSRGLELFAHCVPLLNLRGWAYTKSNKLEFALADFSEALRLDTENSEAHTGLGYVSAGLGADEVARREASTALLLGSNNYLVLHNVACVYGRLSAATRQKTELENLAIAALQRAVAVNTQIADTHADEVGLIQQEIEVPVADSAFPESIRSRAEFKALLSGSAQKGGHDSSEDP